MASNFPFGPSDDELVEGAGSTATATIVDAGTDASHGSIAHDASFDGSFFDGAGLEKVGATPDIEPVTLLEQAQNGGISRLNKPVTIAGGVEYDADALNEGLRGISDSAVRERFGLDQGD